ncbi:MAG: hypothetical protein LBU11_03795 [Zoogloeaceae bacterium]|jgi:hypothetical protein|nr:hypothetical protein [Zoogloeaceae bacterium]
MTRKKAKKTGDASLEDLVELAYRLFAAYPAPEKLAACEHCMGMEAQERVRTTAVRDIPADLFWRYHFAALDDKRMPLGEVKYFLPRYLDLISRFEEGSVGFEGALTHLPPETYRHKEKFTTLYSRLNPDDWKAEEFTLLNAWAKAFFSRCLSQYYDYDLFPDVPRIESIDEMLIMLAHGGFDLSPLLDLWAEDHRLTALLHAKDLLLWGFNEEMTAMENAFAENDEALCATLSGWLQTAKVCAHFRQGCENALARQDPILEMAHGFHAGRTHREELEIMRQRLRNS